MIEGVKVTPLKQISDERGKVMHMMSEESTFFERFGEIYFSYTIPGAVKAWRLHKKMTLNYAVINGEIKCVLFDDRENSSTRGNIEEFFMSPENYFLLTVPPLIWNGWKSIGDKPSIIANCSTLKHDPNEIARKSSFDNSIPYKWD